MRLTAAAVAIAVLATQSALAAPIVGLPANAHLSVSSVPVISELYPSHVVSSPLLDRLNGLQTREVQDLLQREEFAGFARELEDILARDDLVDESGAFNFNTIKKIFNIGGIALDGANILGHLLPGSSQPQPTATPAQRRDLQELDARDFQAHSFVPIRPPFVPVRPPPRQQLGFMPPQSSLISQLGRINPPPLRTSIAQRELVELIARQLSEDESGATLASSFGKFIDIAKKVFSGVSIASDAANIIGHLTPSQSQNPTPTQSGAPQARELVELIARQLSEDESGASLASTFGKVIDVVKNVFKDGSKLSKIADGVSIASDASDIVGNLIPGHKQAPPPTQSGAPQARELVELLARQLSDDESGATFASSLGKVFGKVKEVFKNGDKLSKAADGFSIVSSGADILGHLIPGHNQPPPPPAQSGTPQARELVELLARQISDDESGASLASTFGKVVDVVKDVFHDGKKLSNVADGFSAASAASGFLGHLIHPPAPAQSQAPQAREVSDVLTRAMEARELNELD